MPWKRCKSAALWSTAALALLTTLFGATEPSAGVGVSRRVTWGPVTTLAEVGDETLPVAISVAPDGTTTAVWTNARQAVMAARRPTGGPWRKPVRIGTGNSPSLETDDEGIVTVVWVGAGRGHRVWAVRRPRVGPWRDPVAISRAFPALPEECHAAVHADLAVSGRGAAAVVWEWGSLDCNVPYRVEVAYRPSGGTWRDPVEVHRGDPAFGYPRSEIALDARGDALLAYADDDGTVKVARRPRGHHWRPASSVGHGDWPRLAVRRSGAAVVVWQTERARLKAATRASHGPWTAPTTLLDDVDFAGYATTMDGSGTATVVALERPSRRVSKLVAVRRPRHGSWRHPVELARPGGQPIARTNRAGEVLVAWVGQDGLEASRRPRLGPWGAPRTVTRRVDFSFDVTLSDSGDAAFLWNDDGRIKARSAEVR